MRIDAFGKQCPLPLMMAKKELDGGHTDLSVMVDNQTAVGNLQKLSHRYDLDVSVEDIEGGFLVSFSKKTLKAPEQEAFESASFINEDFLANAPNLNVSSPISGGVIDEDFDAVISNLIAGNDKPKADVATFESDSFADVDSRFRGNDMGGSKSGGSDKDSDGSDGSNGGTNDRASSENDSWRSGFNDNGNGGDSQGNNGIESASPTSTADILAAFSVEVNESHAEFRPKHNALSVNALDEAFMLETADNKPEYSVFIAKDHLGEGDRELGANLMRMALYTFSALTDVPSAIFLMNSGVKLSASFDKQIIESLKTLEEKGTQILICGACADWYDLKDQIEVGEISNMYDILEMMTTSDKVITL